MRPVRVVTVDDQPHFRAAAHALVDSLPGFELVGEAVDAEDALRAVPELDADMVLVGVRLPGVDGIEVAERLHAADASRVIVLVTTLDPHTLSGLAKRSGAAALLSKQWLTPRLLRGLWVAHRRR